MFWKILQGAAKAAFHINRTVTALGTATIIILGVHDYLKHRRSNRRTF